MDGEHEFRLRILRIMAVCAAGIGLISIVIDALALVLDNNWYLAGSGLAWVCEIGIMFWTWQLLNRDRVQAAANTFIISGSILISTVAMLDTSSGVMVHLCIGCPFLILVAFALTPSEQHTRWRIAISAVFPAGLLLRQLWRPMEIFADTGEFVGAVVGGGLGVFAMASLGQVLFSRLHEARDRIARDRDKLAVLNVALEESRDAAVAANRAKAAFLAVMSHELRTPLNAIIGYSEMMRDDVEAGDDASIDDLQHILGAGRNLLLIVGDILDFTALERGAITLDLEPTDMDALALELAADGAAFAAANGNSFESRFEDLGTVKIDAGKLQRAVDSLLSNASKFTENGRIELSIQRKEDGLQIEVSDDGMGMDPENVEHLFGAFTLADDSYTRVRGGTGLGLAIVDRYVRAMGGTVAVETQPDRGSTFTVWIPQ